tara:strand:+ start:652 stop:1053 length:402 start_codon:yes stop_codon:yes gene_type:complete
MAVKVNEYVEGKARLLEIFKVKGLKTWRGREGVAAEATVYRDGKKVGRVRDDGDGGQVTFDAIGWDPASLKSWWDVQAILDALPKYKFKDYYKEECKEEWDGEVEPTKEPWLMYVFADVMLTLAEKESQLKKE